MKEVQLIIEVKVSREGIEVLKEEIKADNIEIEEKKRKAQMEG